MCCRPARTSEHDEPKVPRAIVGPPVGSGGRRRIVRALPLRRRTWLSRVALEQFPDDLAQGLALAGGALGDLLPQGLRDSNRDPR